MTRSHKKNARLVAARSIVPQAWISAR